jgi:putative ABC transport system substrate-binding protein
MRRRGFITLLGFILASSMRAHAQPLKRSPRIGVLWHAKDAKGEGEYYVAFHQGFRDLGYVDGRTIEFEERFAAEVYDRFKNFADELVALKVDVLVCVTQPAAIAAQAATSSIPIVFITVADPIGAKLVNSLARPGGNITGLSNMGPDIMTKRLQLLKEMVPSLSRAALLVNPSDARATGRNIDEAQSAAGQLKVTVQPYQAQAAADLKPVFAAIAQDRMHGVFVVNDPMIFDERKQIADLALFHHLPLLLQNRPGVEAGSLMSYGTDSRSLFRRAPIYVDKILKGDKPGELPVEQPIKFEFLINLRTAKALGLDVPPTLLARADEVIE